MENRNYMPQKQERGKLDMESFPSYNPLLREALKYTAISGCRFLKQDVSKAQKYIEQKMEPPSDNIAFMMELLPTINVFKAQIMEGNKQLEQQCFKAQKVVVREGVEKACLSAIHQLEIEPDPNIKGEDWDNLNQPFLTCCAKLINFFEGARKKKREHQRMLLTGMFVTDFGLWCGIPKVSCEKDEKLLSDFLDKAGQFSKQEGKEFSSTQILETTLAGLSGIINYFPVGLQDNLKNLGDTVLLTSKGFVESGKDLSGSLLETGKGISGAVRKGIIDYASKDGIFSSSWSVKKKAKVDGKESPGYSLLSGSGLASTLLDTMGSIYPGSSSSSAKKSSQKSNMEVRKSSNELKKDEKLEDDKLKLT